jgi:hypothetical protein
LNGAIAFVCKDLLGGKSVTYFLSLSSRYGNYSESELREMRKDKWANQSVKYKLKWSEDGKKRWDDREDKKKWWDDQSDENKLEFGANVRKGAQDKQKK